MRALVVFYSRTGVTRKVADDIVSILYAEKEKLEDLKNRDGIFGWFSGGRDATMKKETIIEKTEKDPSKFDIVILGTPIWAGNMTPAIRTYISKNKKHFKNVAFFCTSGGGRNIKGAIKNMEFECRKIPICVFSSTSHDVKHDNYLEDVKEFCDEIEKSVDNKVHIIKTQTKPKKIVKNKKKTVKKSSKKIKAKSSKKKKR